MFANVFWDLKILCSWDKVSEVPTNIEGNNSFRMWKCEKFLSSLASLARIYIDFLNVSVLLVCCCLYRHTTRNTRELHWLYMYTDVLWDLKMYMFLRRSLTSLARSRIFMYTIFFLLSVWGFCPPPPIPKSWLRYCHRIDNGKIGNNRKVFYHKANALMALIHEKHIQQVFVYLHFFRQRTLWIWRSGFFKAITLSSNITYCACCGIFNA